MTISLGFAFSIVGCLKIYYLISAVSDYLKEKNPQNTVEVGSKSESIKLDVSQGNVFNSQNYIFEETFSEKNQEK